MTIAQASRLTNLSRPAVRRCLHTLVRLGYAAQDGQAYRLQSKVLALGYAYLSSSSLARSAQPMLDALRDDLRESCSLGVIEGDQVCYIARAEVSRIMSVALQVGSRLPLYCTSMGRVLLAGETRSQQEAYLRRVDLIAHTPRTVIQRSDLIALFAKAGEEGYAIVDQELEIGLRSVAVPVFGRTGIVAALNVGTPAGSLSMADLRTRCLPALRRAARDLGAMINDR